jgi:PAS domain S-box-containing protein
MMQPESFASGTLFSRIFHASPVAMTITTPGEGVYVDVNDAYAALVVQPRENLIGRPDRELLRPLPTFLNYPHSNQPTEQPCQLVTTDGVLRDVITSTQIEQWDGKPYVFTLVRDLTDLNQVQDAVRRSEARFRLFFQSIPLPIFVFDVETFRILDVNTTAVNLYGYTRDELLAMTILDIRPKEERARFIEVISALPENAKLAGCWKHRRKDGTLFDVELTSYGLQLGGRSVRIHMLQDVTEKLAMQAALHDRERKLRIIADVTTDVIWEFDLSTQTVIYSTDMRQVFGHETGRGYPVDWWWDHIHADDYPVITQSLVRALGGPTSNWNAQYRFLRADGHYAFVLNRCYILRDAMGLPTRVIGAMVDISTQMEVKEAAARAAQIERHRLARDLHDAVTQSLYSLSLMAEAARRRALDGDVKATKDYVMRLGELAQQALKEMRLLVYELQPSALEDEGLAGALQGRLDAVERRAGVQARLHVEMEEQLPADVQLQFYRIAEEALNNALKHAGASIVRVRVAAIDGAATLEISDNGKGFDPNPAHSSGGLGLISIRERQEQLGGRLDIETVPGKGTTIRVTVPMVEKEYGQTDSNSHL